jgi:glycosyltransferase 2 family protein
VTGPRKPGKLLDWKAILGILLSIALLYWALRNEDFGKVVQEIRGANPFWFVASIVSATVVFWLRAWRWGPLLATSFPDASFTSRFRATTIGFMGNNLLPARIGEFARAYALARQERGSMVSAFASLLAERLFDAMAVVGFLFLAMLMPGFPDVVGRQFSTMANGMAIAILALIVFCFALVLFPIQTVRFFEDRIAPLLPAKVRRPLVDALEAFLLGLSSLRSPGLLGRVSFQTIVLWIVNASGFYFAFRAFGIDVPFSGALFLQSIVALAVSAPSSPGFFGPFEAATKLVLVELYAVDSARAVGFAFGFHLGGFIPVTLMGLFYAWKLGLSWREVEYSETTVEEAVERELPGAQPQEDRGT